MSSHNDNLLSTDLLALKEKHKFVRDEQEDASNLADWKTRMSRKFYDQLYKEYATIDLSRYKEGQFGLRWRTKQEVLDGKGESICGAKRCYIVHNLKSFELPFKYKENGTVKKELVKIRVCRNCREKLKYYRRLCSAGTKIDCPNQTYAVLPSKQL